MNDIQPGTVAFIPLLLSDLYLFTNHAGLFCIVQCLVITSTKEVMFLPVFVRLSVCVCEQDNSKSYGRIFLKF